MDESLFQGKQVKSSRILYTPSPFARANLIHLQETGSLEALSPHVSKREHLSSYLFFCVVSGMGILEYDGKSHLLKQGDCVFIDCKKSYSHCTSDELWTLQWVHFYGPNMNGIYQKYIERGGRPCFRPANHQAYLGILQELYELAGSSDYIRDMKIFEKLAGLLTLLMEESWHPEDRKRNSLKRQNLENVKEYLEQHYQEKINLDNLAEEFYINKFYLTRIFKEQFGVSINNYLLQTRITHAKQLLRFTDLTIEAVSAECGMGDANYFSRMFKKVEGVTPGEFRRMW